MLQISICGGSYYIATIYHQVQITRRLLAIGPLPPFLLQQVNENLINRSLLHIGR